MGLLLSHYLLVFIAQLSVQLFCDKLPSTRVSQEYPILDVIIICLKDIITRASKTEDDEDGGV